MQEFYIETEYKEIMKIPRPFFVCATMNPRETSTGVFPLTEANLDRFMINEKTDYLDEEEMVRMIKQDDSEPSVNELEKCLCGGDILKLWKALKRYYKLDAEAHGRTVRYIARLCRATRPQKREKDVIIPRNFIPEGDRGSVYFSDAVEAGASDRRPKFIMRAARARAFLDGDNIIKPEHVKKVAHGTLSHVIKLGSQAGPLGITTDNIIDFLLEETRETA